MTSEPRSSLTLREHAAQATDRLRSIAQQLSARGLDARIATDNGFPYLTAWAPHARRRGEILIDEEGHCTLEWDSTATDPAELATAIVRLLAAIPAMPAAQPAPPGH